MCEELGVEPEAAIAGKATGCGRAGNAGSASGHGTTGNGGQRCVLRETFLLPEGR